MKKMKEMNEEGITPSGWVSEQESEDFGEEPEDYTEHDSDEELDEETYTDSNFFAY
jgi:hypothetical protein